MINPNVVTESYIETNGGHSLTFNGNVKTLTVQAYAGTTMIFNGDVTLTGDDLLANADLHDRQRNDSQHHIQRDVNLEPWSGGRGDGFRHPQQYDRQPGAELLLSSYNI